MNDAIEIFFPNIGRVSDVFIVRDQHVLDKDHNVDINILEKMVAQMAGAQGVSISPEDMVEPALTDVTVDLEQGELNATIDIAALPDGDLLIVAAAADVSGNLGQAERSALARMAPSHIKLPGRRRVPVH